MKEQANIDLFRIYAGATFAALYEVFPLGRATTAAELVDRLGLADDPATRTCHLAIIEAAWQWLKDTGYLRQDPATGALNLTPRSFEGLTFLDDPATAVCRGDKLRQLSSNIGRATVAETIAELVTQVLGSGARAAYSYLA